jgi:hypothetical protein
MSGGAAVYDERCMAYMRMALQQVSLVLSSFGAAVMPVCEIRRLCFIACARLHPSLRVLHI